MVFGLITQLRRGWVAVSLTLLCFASPLSWAQGGEQDPQYRASIDAFHSALIEIMQMTAHAEREAVIHEQVEAIFDLPRIAAVSLGRTWRDLAEEDRSTFVALLSELIAATYADRFDGYDGQRFETIDVASVRGGYVVRTQLHRKSGKAVSLDYFMRARRVFNVVADGVSDLSLRRADYSSIVKNQGFDALLDHMQRKILIARSGS